MDGKKKIEQRKKYAKKTSIQDDADASSFVSMIVIVKDREKKKI